MSSRHGDGTPRSMALGLVLLMLVSACGDGGGDTGPAELSRPSTTSEGAASSPSTITGAQQESPTTQASTAPQAPAVESDFPDLVVNDLSGGELNLKSLAPSDVPVLLWFWAPH